MIKIVTDSTAYLPPQTIEQYDIQVVPLYVHFGDQAFRELVDLTIPDFYARLKAAPQLPTTSQPSAGEFYQVFQRLAEAGHEILCLTISSKLSGTWNSAIAAKEMLPDATISVVDTLSTSIGLHLLVQAAAEAVQSGATLQQVTDQIEKAKHELYVLFVVDTLEYLAKGGRIGNAKAFLGSMLKVKPILRLHEGAIEPLEQVRSKGKALAHVIQLVQEHAGTRGDQARLAIAHALTPGEADQVKQELRSRLGCPEPAVAELGPVIGTHTGPGVVGVAMHV